MVDVRKNVKFYPLVRSLRDGLPLIIEGSVTTVDELKRYIILRALGLLFENMDDKVQYAPAFETSRWLALSLKELKNKPRKLAKILTMLSEGEIVTHSAKPTPATELVSQPLLTTNHVRIYAPTPSDPIDFETEIDFPNKDLTTAVKEAIKAVLKEHGHRITGDVRVYVYGSPYTYTATRVGDLWLIDQKKHFDYAIPGVWGPKELDTVTPVGVISQLRKVKIDESVKQKFEAVLKVLGLTPESFYIERVEPYISKMFEKVGEFVKVQKDAINLGDIKWSVEARFNPKNKTIDVALFDLKTVEYYHLAAIPVSFVDFQEDSMRYTLKVQVGGKAMIVTVNRGSQESRVLFAIVKELYPMRALAKL